MAVGMLDHSLRYGEGTLPAEPLAQALDRFRRRATVIGESPDEASNEQIRAALLAAREPGSRQARRSRP
jgi:hypothetical protein